MRRLVAFDVCDTLYRCNTTVEYLRFLHRGSVPLRALVWFVTSGASPVRYLLRMVGVILDQDLGKRVLLMSLRGERVERLEHVAREFVEARLSLLRVDRVHQAMESHKLRGDRVVLVSASLDVVVGSIGAKLGCEWVASELLQRGGVCAGLLARDLTGKKAAALAERLHGQSHSGLSVYSDNLTDRDFLALSDDPHVIVPPGGSVRAWRGFEADYIRLK